MSLLQRTASALAGDRTGKVDLNLDQLRTDGGTQPRAEINVVVVRDYAEAITGGVELPAVTVFYDGAAYWLADGYHRLAAHRLADKRSILADVRQGTQRDAVLWSVGANADHGLRRTDEDKRRAVVRLLEDKEWSQWSDREIARQCKVSHPFVGKLRADLTGNVTSEQPQERTYTTKHGTQATMRTGNIGGQAKAEPAQRIVEAEAPVLRAAATAAGLPRMGIVERATATDTFPDRSLGRLAATLAAALTSLDDDELRGVATGAHIGLAYGDVINELRRLHELTKLALRQ